MDSPEVYISHASLIGRTRLIDTIRSYGGVIVRVRSENITKVCKNTGLNYDYDVFFDKAVFRSSQDLLAFKIKHPEYISTIPFKYTGTILNGY